MHGQDKEYLILGAEIQRELDDNYPLEEDVSNEFARASLERVLKLFYGTRTSGMTFRMRVYLLWYRYAQNKEVHTLTKWTNLYEGSLMAGKSLFIPPTEYTPYIYHLVKDFTEKRVPQQYYMGVAYALYYLMTLLLMSEVIFDDALFGELLVEQKNVTANMKPEEFLLVVEKMCSLFYDYMKGLEIC